MISARTTAPRRVLDPEKCRHYAQFASRLQTHSFDIIYWPLFSLVVFMLFLSSWYYGRSIDAVEKFSPRSPEHRRQMKKCMCVCALCTAVSIASVVMETFALLALQFCDGEDLLQLYWSTFTMVQIGSVVAIFGVMLSVWHSLRGRKHPPWALALGTPVLVIAGLGHFFNAALQRKIKEKARRRKEAGGSAASMSLSQSPTQQNEGEGQNDQASTSYNAKLIGYTPGGGPIIQFDEKPEPLDEREATVISTGIDGAVTVAFGKEVKIVVSNEETAEEQATCATPGMAEPNSVSFAQASRTGSVSGQTLVAAG
ncbi:uncharacterized protein E0L32_003703 [Thyridium curvatum]|uniref:Uncharacterized protein n=1 Tax=Thyridium curvatum TaxID=1093900 RepID=A0A507B3D2_9PEZI|nr:uncharacterized protein E0L32_003703 [Thyridium curvatum]TPX16762.1 hypothetical protein E0L32_003703 [Thyridium curvatum]